MKKSSISILLTAMLVVQLCGCGAGEKKASDAPKAAQDAAGADSQGSILDPSAILSLKGKDNSLDAYSATVRVPLQTEKPENALDGGIRRSVLSASGAWHLKKHILQTAADSWDELLFATAGENTRSEHFDLKHQLWDIGPAAGTDHYVTFCSEEQEDGEGYRYFLSERDENHETIREFPLEFLKGEFGTVLETIRHFGVDSSGAAHLLQEGRYLIVSQDGEILAEYVPKDGYIREMFPLYDGRIAFCCEENGAQGEMSLQCLDAESGDAITLATLEKNACYFTLLDEDTLLYADGEGVYRSGLSGKNPELLYRWSNHGIITHRVSAMQADGEGRIELIYADSENDTYLCLEPTTEEVTLCEITMEVESYDMDAYQWVVAEFNKRYPSCHIELVGHDPEDDTALLTQLTAGKGPVLLDPSRLNFEELVDLWEPLDTVMEQLGIMEELQPAALEMGKINGTLYGMVRDFTLDTVVVADPDLKDWDYDAFFQCIQDRPELDALCNYYGDSGPYYLISLLNHGLDDNYFIIPDEETGALHFDGDRFRRILELAEKYCSLEEGLPPGSSLLEGKTLCNVLTILAPEEVAAYRTIYGEDLNYIGYPTKDGGAHFMRPASMLSIRRTATKEEKEVAAAFLAMCFSYEGQSLMRNRINFNLSVRKDVLEEQIASMKSKIDYLSFFGEVSMGGNMNIELDRRTLLDIIDQAKPVKFLPRELREILFGELGLYYTGEITEDMLIDHLENRVGLYLGERN